MSEQLYTASRLKVLRQCLRLHLYRYVLGIQMPMGEAARFGTVGHSAIEAWLLEWKKLAGQVEHEVLAQFRLAAALDVIAKSDLSPYDQARMRALVAAYDARWGGEPWEILGVEIEFRYQLGDYTIGGKLDALIRDTRDGRVYVLEHKFTGQDAAPGGVYWERLSIDTQISIYVDGATMLGYEIAGCIYDVLQRPRHEPKLATPEHEREYTKGKGCSKCGGSAGGKAGIVQGTGKYRVAFASEVKENDCEGCAGTGWKLDDEGKPQAPRLVAHQRDKDETLDDFSERVLGEIAANPDAFLIRGTVVRLDDELPRMRADIIESIQLERASALFNLWPRNPDACARFGSMCPMFDACSNRASVADKNRFPRGAAHPELTAVA